MLLRRFPLDDERELVAGDARHLSRAAAEALQSLGGVRQHLVADRMSPDVVDRAEPVEVDDHQADLMVGGRRALDRVVEISRSDRSGWARR